MDKVLVLLMPKIVAGHSVIKHDLALIELLLRCFPVLEGNLPVVADRDERHSSVAVLIKLPDLEPRSRFPIETAYPDAARGDVRVTSA